MKKLTRNIGLFFAGIWLIAWGLFTLYPSSKCSGAVLAILAIAAEFSSY